MRKANDNNKHEHSNPGSIGNNVNGELSLSQQVKAIWAQRQIEADERQKEWARFRAQRDQRIVNESTESLAKVNLAAITKQVIEQALQGKTEFDISVTQVSDLDSSAQGRVRAAMESYVEQLRSDSQLAGFTISVNETHVGGMDAEFTTYSISLALQPSCVRRL